MSAPPRVKLGIVGLGKIARDQHLPSLAASPDFELVAVASPNDGLPGIPSYGDLQSLLDARTPIQAVAICTMPQARFALAKLALEAGLHVLLEKPPGVTVDEVRRLEALAARQRRSLFASWHSRHACAVAAAGTWLSSRRIQRSRIVWKEDVRVWHPGQSWLWQAGGLGVFDPGINALSIVTCVVREHLAVRDASLHIPTNCQTPIAADLKIKGSAGVEIDADLDFLQAGPPTWNILINTDRGDLLISSGGAALSIDGTPAALEDSQEYPTLYAHFARLIREGRSDVDLAPLRLVEEAMHRGTRIAAAPFIE